MPSGTPNALTVIRVARGGPPPSEAELQAAIDRDRVRLRLRSDGYKRDLSVAGPYPIIIEGQELDEYVVWER